MMKVNKEKSGSLKKINVICNYSIDVTWNIFQNCFLKSIYPLYKFAIAKLRGKPGQYCNVSIIYWFL